MLVIGRMPVLVIATPMPSDALLSPPPRIPDHTLLRRIGRGAYGEVWLARNVMGAWRAVKVVWRERFESGRPYEREFEGIRKFEPVSRTHDSQVDILHAGRNDTDGYFYYVMELGDDQRAGQEIDPVTYAPRTLRSEMDARGGRLPAVRCMEIGIALCQALEHLHEHGLIHRDVKPSNVIFVHARPKLADIGLVAGAGEAMSFVGTEGFVPPEGPGSPRADLFSLGKVLYEINTGLDRGEFPELPTQLAADDDAHIARELNFVILKACAPLASNRHRSARELREELQLLQDGRSIQRIRAAERRAAQFRRLGLAAILVAAVALVGYFSARRANARADASADRARESLAGARLEQARALRVSGLAGRRAAALAAIREAALIRPTRALRDEAIATLALTDLGARQSFLPHPADAISKVYADPSGAQISPDFERVAWCMVDGSVSIARFADGTAGRILPATGASALGLCWSPDGRYLAVRYRGETRVWDWAEGRAVLAVPVNPLIGEKEPPASFSSDSRRAAFTTDGRCSIRELPGGREVLSLRPLPEIEEYALHPSHPWVAFRAGKDAVVYDFESEEILKVYSLNSSVLRVAWSPDGRVLAAAMRDGSLHAADVVTRNKHYFRQHADRPLRIVFQPGGDLFASHSRDGDTRLWDTLAGGSSICGTFEGLAQAFSPDGRRLAYSSAEGVGTWPLTTGTPAYRSLVGRMGYDLMECLEFSPDGRWLVSMADSPDGLWIWDVATGRLVAERVAAGPRRRWLQFTPDGRRLITLGEDGVNVWPLSTEAGLLHIGEPQPIALPPPVALDDTAALSADGRKLVARVWASRALLIDLEDPTQQTSIETETAMGSLALDPRTGAIAIGSRQNSGTQILAPDGQRPLAILGQNDANALYSPDGKWLANYSATRCEIYDARTLRLVKTYPRQQIEKLAGQMAFSADSHTFAYFLTRSRVELVDTRTLTSFATVELPDGAAGSHIRFSPDGIHLAIHSKSRLHLYHLPALRQELATLGLDW